LIDLLKQGLAEREEIHLNDASVAALELYRLHRDNLLDFIKTTDHGKLLIQLGFERDIEFAVELDKVSVVPVSNGFSFVSLK
jgi:2-phosphosulfolactate phosphatase